MIYRRVYVYGVKTFSFFFLAFLRFSRERERERDIDKKIDDDGDDEDDDNFDDKITRYVSE